MLLYNNVLKGIFRRRPNRFIAYVDINGKIEKAFEADGYLSTAGYVIEVEAGRAVVNYQFLKDFFEACTMVGVDKLCIAVRNKYRAFNDFDRVCKFFEAMYASNRLGIPLSGLLIIGY